jgi:hypothetical protein
MQETVHFKTNFGAPQNKYACHLCKIFQALSGECFVLDSIRLFRLISTVNTMGAVDEYGISWKN